MPDYFNKNVGANSLQIAAIYQIQAFLCGDYGKYFQQPAFALLKSLWSELMRSHAKVWPQSSLGHTGDNAYDMVAQRIDYKNWRREVKLLVGNPLMQAIACSLVYDGGSVLRQHERELTNSNFLGLDATLGEHALELEESDLSYSNWQCANLSSSYLEGTNLRGAHMEGADISRAHLDGADMRGSYFSGANLIGANLGNINLSNACMIKADMQNALIFKVDMSDVRLQRANMLESRLERVSLIGARLDNVDLSYAKLKNVNFQSADLRNTLFIDPMVDGLTDFTGVKNIDSIKVLKTLDDVNYLGTVESRYAWKNGDYSKFNEEESIKLRRRLRDENNLVLPEIAYKEL